MKYVIIKCTVASVVRVYPFIFPEQLTHSEVARWVERAVSREFGCPTEVFSAGFCFVDSPGNYCAQVGSESLRLEKNAALDSRDTRILNMPNAMQNMLLD